VLTVTQMELEYSRWDSNPRLAVSETVASAVGLLLRAYEGNRTLGQPLDRRLL
jgi:hypothetical protein